MALMDWRVSLGLLAVPLTGVGIASAWVGRQMAQEVSQGYAPTSWFVRTFVFVFTALPPVLLIFLPWQLLYSQEEYIDDANLFVLVISWGSCLGFVSLEVLTAVRSQDIERKQQQRVVRFTQMLALLLASFTLIGVMRSVYTAHENTETYYENDYYGASRIVAMNEIAYDDDYRTGYTYNMQLEWPCQGTLCQSETDVVCGFVENTPYKYQPMYYDNYRYFHVYNVDDGQMCQDFATCINDVDYDSYATPEADGSPYVSIFGNCTTCSAHMLIFEENQEIALPLRYLVESAVHGCFALVALYLMTVANRGKGRASNNNEAAVELVPTHGELS